MSTTLRIALVLPLCVVGLLLLSALWAVYSEDYPHFEHRCFSEEDFVNGLLPHERALFRLAGHDGVVWGYSFAAVGIVALGACICRPRSVKRDNSAESGIGNRL